MLKWVIAFYLYFICRIVADDGDGGEFLLCAHCSHRIAPLNRVEHRKSPYALKTWNTSLFESKNKRNQSVRPDVYSMLYKTIQLVENPMKIRFQLVTVTAASDVDVFLVEETTSLEHTWFPGFQWTICLCPKCFGHIGWHFQAVFSDLENNETTFLALILDKLAYNGRLLIDAPIHLFKDM